MKIERGGVEPRMSQIVVHNETVYLAGQVAKNYDGGVAEQTESMLENVDLLLAEAQSSREQILSATIYLRNMQDYAAMNKVWDAWVPQGKAPARACVETRLACPEILVEVSIIAAVS